MDRRVTPANGRVAAEALRGTVAAKSYVAGQAARIVQPVANLCRAPDGPRDRQLLFGAALTCLERQDGWAFVQAQADGYVGYVPEASLGPAQDATHLVATPATHLYAAPDFKARDLMGLSFGSRVTVLAELRRFWETSAGFIPKPHLRPLDRPFADPVTIAQMHFGVPYLWGGNTVWGIDCSGLVQAALRACAIACPGDSDLQRAAVGRDLAEDAAPLRGDLWFWAGHVGLVVDATTLIHANAHHMAVAYEPLDKAALRIAAQDNGPVIARKRL